MASTVKKYAYQAFGLHITSDIALPELLPIVQQREEPDVDIRIEDLTSIWDESLFRNSHYAGGEGQVFFNLTGIANVRIRNGSEIVVSPVAGSDENQIRLYVLGSCMGALLMQRKVLPLHGSAVVINGKAYAFIGESGAGKSTLAATCVRQGYSLVSDDVIAVTLSEAGDPVVTPSYPQQKLWQESLQGLGMGTAPYAPLYGGVNKYAIPVKSGFSSEPVPLGGIYELIPAGSGTTICRLQGLEPLPALRIHTYRGILIPVMNLEKWHFHMTARIASRSEMYQVRRTTAEFAPEQLLEQILGTIFAKEDQRL